MQEDMKIGGRRLRKGEVIKAQRRPGARKQEFRIVGFDPEHEVAEVWGPIGAGGEGSRYLPLDQLGARVRDAR